MSVDKKHSQLKLPLFIKFFNLKLLY